MFKIRKMLATFQIIIFWSSLSENFKEKNINLNYITHVLHEWETWSGTI